MEGREGRGRGRKGREGAAEKGGQEAWEEGAGGSGGQRRVGGWGRRKFYLRVELIKCIDPNEGEALKRGREGGGGRGGGQAGGRGGGGQGLAEGNFT